MPHDRILQWSAFTHIHPIGVIQLTAHQDPRSGVVGARINHLFYQAHLESPARYLRAEGVLACHYVDW